MTEDTDFISLGKHTDALIQYFVGQLPSSPMIAKLMFDEELRKFFDVLPYIEILNKFIQSRHTETLLFSDLTKILTFFEERQKEDVFPIIIPQGLNITSERDLEWSISAIRFHLMEEMKEFLRLIIFINIPWDQVLQKGIETSSEKIRKYLESILDQFIQTPSLELKNTMKDQIIDLFFSEPMQQIIVDFLPSIFGLKSISFLLNSYAQSFDLLVSFFTRPTTDPDQITISSKSAKNTIKRMKSKHPEFSKSLDTLDPNLRNAIAHRTYHLDEITDELVYLYYTWNKSTKKFNPKLDKMRIKDVQNIVISTKIVTLNFLTGMFFYFLGWMKVQFEPLTAYIKLFYPQIRTDFIARLIGMPLDDLLLSRKLYEQGKFLESSLFSFKMIFLSDKTHFPQKDKEGLQSKSEIFKTMWEEILKLGKEKIDGNIVFGYFLYMLELKCDIDLVSSILKSFIIHYKKQKIEDESSFEIIKEIAEIINLIDPKSVETFILNLGLKYEENMFSFRLKDDFISMIRKQVLLRYENIQSKMHEVVIKTKEALNRVMMEKNDFKTIVNLLIAISDSQIGELTGAEAARIIREREENWPLLAFPKVKICFLEAQNQGYIQIIPFLGDIKGKLTQKGYNLVKLLKSE